MSFLFLRACGCRESGSSDVGDLYLVSLNNVISIWEWCYVEEMFNEFVTVDHFSFHKVP